MRKYAYIIIILIILLFGIFFFKKPFNTGNVIFNDNIKCKDCNIILISIDALRADHLGTYSYYHNTTPYIDEFFKDKTIFENAMSPSPCTTPSVLQFLTGSLMYEDKSVRLAEILKKKGYNTAAVVSQYQFGTKELPKEMYSRGFSFFEIQEGDDAITNKRTAEEVSEIAVEWLKQNNDKGKFFLWLHYFDPHDPYNPPEEFKEFDIFNSKYSDGDRRKYLQESSLVGDWRKRGEEFSSSDVEHFKALYDGEIKFTDRNVGKLLDNLKELDLINNSIIILISDHGEMLGENNIWDHCMTLHELEIHVPFLISVKGGKLLEFSREERLVSTLDVYPTIIDLLGLKNPSQKLDGESLLKLSDERELISTWLQTTSIIKNNWKLYIENGEAIALYNLSVDPLEENDIIKDNEDIAKSLLNQNSSFEQDKLSDKTTEIINELKSLGYVN